MYIAKKRYKRCYKPISDFKIWR